MYMPRKRPIASLACVILLLAAGACGRSQAAQDITKILTVSDTKTGWYDAGVENGMNKLVPSIVLTLTNSAREPVSNVQLNAVIRRVGENEEWGGAYVKVIGAGGLAPG